VKAFNPILYFGFVFVGILRLSGAISEGQGIAFTGIALLAGTVGMMAWEERNPDAPLLRELREARNDQFLRRFLKASVAILVVLWAAGTLSFVEYKRSMLVFAIFHLIVMSVWFIGKFSSVDRGRKS
jgi:hypothetical protein